MRRILIGVASAALVLGACTRTATVQSGGEVNVPVTPANSSVLPVGSTLRVSLDNTLGTSQSKVGDTFSATVNQDVVAQNGDVVVPAGSKAYGTVTQLKASSRVGDQAVIRVNFDSLMVSGRSHPLKANVTATALTSQQNPSTSSTLKKAGIGAAAGAVLGAVLGSGDLKNILIGGALGAAVGTAISLGTGDVEALLPAGTQMTLQLTQQVAMR